MTVVTGGFKWAAIISLCGGYHTLMKRRLLTALLALCFSFRAVADGLPDLGDSAQAEISPQMERSIGQAIVREIRFSESTYLDDPELEDYLETIGARLVAVSATPSQGYRFFVLHDKSINAAAMLGGVLVFNTGLIQAVQSESELASVMAHEISHVQQRHMARMIAQQQSSGYVAIASMLLAILAAKGGGGDTAGALVMTGQAVAAQSQLSYSRDFEREADRIGLQVLEAAEFDPHGMPQFFERLQRATRLEDNSAFAYLRTHPLTSERIGDVGNRVHRVPYRQRVDSVEFALVKAKIESLESMPQEVLKRFSGEPPQRQLAAATHWYARTQAHLRLGNLAAADQDFASLRRVNVRSPMVDLLEANLLRAHNDPDGAIRLLRAARTRFPSSHALLYAELDALIVAGRAREASQLANERVRLDPQDDRLFALLARASAAQGQRLAQHRAQAEVYYLRGALPAAIEQLQLGLREGDADFYDKSALEARLAEFKEQRRQQQQERKR